MILLDECTLEVLTDKIDLNNFYCKEEDLNDFLKNEALDYCNQLMGVTYVFTLDTKPSEIVCFFTVSNDVLNLEKAPNNSKNRVNRSIPNAKRKLEHYPSVKIGRLGINKTFKGLKIGKQLMDFIKEWFFIGNKTGCRFIIVDAYNKEKVILYYQSCGFKFLIADEITEANLRKEDDENKLTYIDRSKYFFKKMYWKVFIKEEKVEPYILKTRFMYFDLMSLKPTKTKQIINSGSINKEQN